MPPPTVNPESLKNINANNDDMNPLFFSGLEEFKSLLWDVLGPKNSFNDGEVVTGEGEYGRSQELHLLLDRTSHLLVVHIHIIPVLLNLHSVPVSYRL